jgi:phospholipase/carboxylesterase
MSGKPQAPPHKSKLFISMNSSIVVQQPAQQPKQLYLLFHGVGSTPQSLQSVASKLAHEFPEGMVVCVAAPFTCDLGAGLQWFSVQGITEDNRPERIQAALPFFAQEVARWQRIAHVTAEQTSLIGFSQGAIIALAASALSPLLAGNIVAHSGRFAPLPEAMSREVTLHLIHGERDDVVPVRHCTEAAHRLAYLGANFTLDTLPSLGHHMNGESADLLIERLKN